ncbi:MAG: 3-oxoacyl-ACP reductase FabG [Bacteroidetes bacterium]|nr:3-oxoacyl-ACP reductase FabG [Bacteroidota bacterium]MDA1120331.1 3-oxoacyl-ACP reductase FabG [Bacteroidota bacterium]
MPFSLKNHVALVTGSTKGLGKQIAITLGKSGAKVCLNYANNREKAEASFSEFLEARCEGILVRSDVTDFNQIQSMVREVEESLGEIDILVVNATPDQPQKPIEEYDLDFYQSMMDFFIKSPFLLTKAVVAGMKRKKWGRIINIGSEVFQTCVPNFSAYVAAKGGQVGWTRSMATELAPFGITVNIIAPAWIPVERHEKDPQEMKDEYLAGIPAGRWGVPKDVADAVLYFASEEASFVSGQTLCVNGAHTPW